MELMMASPDEKMDGRRGPGVLKGRANLLTCIAAGVFLMSSLMAHAQRFGNDMNGYAWADVPAGKFECRNDPSTNNLQVLKLNGKKVFSEARTPDGINEGNTLASGIRQQNVGCPLILANEMGYVLIVRDTQPPAYGLQGYALINFNQEVPTLTVLGEGLRPKDDRIPEKRRVKWLEQGVLLHYFGYAPGTSGGSRFSPKAALHDVRFEFATNAVLVLR